jgi:hypothetical protein
MITWFNSEMMPDYGWFYARMDKLWIVLPLIRHVFGVQPDAYSKSIIFEPHLPSGWEDISIENLPAEIIFSLLKRPGRKTNKGIEFVITSKEQDWI